MKKHHNLIPKRIAPLVQPLQLKQEVKGTISPHTNLNEEILSFEFVHGIG